MGLADTDDILFLTPLAIGREWESTFMSIFIKEPILLLKAQPFLTSKGLSSNASTLGIQSSTDQFCDDESICPDQSLCSLLASWEERLREQLLGTVRGLTRLPSITLHSGDRGSYSQTATDCASGQAPSLLSVAYFSSSLLGNFWPWVKIDFWRPSPIRPM